MKSAATPLPPGIARPPRPGSLETAAEPAALPPGRPAAARFAGPAAGVLLAALWVLLYPHTPDLAGQVYRVDLFRRLGFVVWDEHWYAGHHLPAYSLIFPPLGSLLGIRVLGASAVILSCVLFERLAGRAYGKAARWGAVFFAVAAVGDVWAGRVTFALGVSVALAAALALGRGRPVLASVLSLACAAASPVAALLLGLAALALSLHERSVRALLVLALPAGVLVVVLALLFPEGGYEPYPITSFAATAVVMLLFLWALPARERLLRIGGVLYLLACAACLLVHTPVGSNIERLGVLLAGPLLLCALAAEREQTGARAARGALIAALALCAAGVWVLWGPVRETAAVSASPATSAAYYVPLERFIATQPGPLRIEVPLTRSHWEAALLAPSVSLARGWEKQLEMRYDRALLSHGLTAGSYRRWLDEQAVALVALPDVPLDPSSAREGDLIRAGLPYLREIYTSAHWRVFRVIGATPIATGPGRLAAMGHDSFALRATGAGSFLVRVHYTRYMTLTQGSGCVGSAPGGWTRVSVDGPGVYVVSARFSLSRALGAGATCQRRAS